MTRTEFEKLWAETLRSQSPTTEELDRAAGAVLELHVVDAQFRQHIGNRSERVTKRTGLSMDPENFNVDGARAYVADEIGFASWGKLLDRVNEPPENVRPILFDYTVAAMERGDFSALEAAIGPEDFHLRIVDWYENGLFEEERETLAEVLSAACMLGRTKTAEYLIDKDVDPYAGMRSWLAGPHYAVSSGRLETVKMLLGKRIPLEVENRYGGTLLGQALWSAINEHASDHAEIIELLIAAGAHVWPGTSEWWDQQQVPSASTKTRVADALKKVS